MDVSDLKPGDDHYMAYVGPPTQYDFMGATQFRLLCTLGLRADNTLLDVGCGSLRAGRLFLSYLNRERYYGIEPNQWLIVEAIKNEIGQDLVSIKQPHFDYNSEFKTDVFSRQFDFIVAQSIFSHTGPDLIRIALKNFAASLNSDGLIAATFVEGEQDFIGEGWVYPECVDYRQQTVENFAKEVGLSVIRIPWYHPRQTWYLFAKSESRLPQPEMLHFLRGAVLFDPEFGPSRRPDAATPKTLLSLLKSAIPQPVKRVIKGVLDKS